MVGAFLICQYIVNLHLFEDHGSAEIVSNDEPAEPEHGRSDQHDAKLRFSADEDPFEQPVWSDGTK